MRRFLLLLLSVLCVRISAVIAGQADEAVSEQLSTYQLLPPLKTASQNSTFSDGDLQRHFQPNPTLRLIAFGKMLLVDLKLNSALLSDEFVVTVLSGTKKRSYQPQLQNCHYRGVVRGSSNSSAAVSLCKSAISGFINVGLGEIYYLTAAPGANSTDKVLVSRHSDETSSHELCGVDLEGQNVAATVLNTDRAEHQRARRSVKPPAGSQRDSLYVELVLVADSKMLEKYKRDEGILTRRLIDIANVVNVLYSPLNIFVALVGVEIWNGTDKSQVVSDSEITLKNFLKYRKTDLLLRMPNDNAYLLTAGSFEGSVVGKALKGQMCTYEYSGGVAKDHSRMAGPVGATVAHEMGHNFGMEHDYTDCQCPDERCIMTPASVGQTPSNWSSCSRKYLEDHLVRGIGMCLKKVPKHLTGPSCGNGFLEAGEECDCGPEEFCKNKCCIATNCTLSVNSTCGHGGCCDLNTCSLKPAATVCRDAPNDCDLAEYCDGIVGTCPDDFWVADATPCQSNHVKAYCFDGECKTHESQCQYLWGPTGGVADDKCFQLNIKGNANGNCGHDRQNDNYSMCAVRDAKCGLLHCTSQVDRLVIGAETATSVSQSFIPAKTTYISCRAAYVDFGMDVPDPGMVANGAMCGDKEMCYRQQCIDPSHVPVPACPNNCNGVGVCNNLGHCHCNIGYHPPYCSGSGLGGSIDSGPVTSPESARMFRNAMLVIFLLVVPVVASGLILYFGRFRIRDWLLMKRKLRRRVHKATTTTATGGTVRTNGALKQQTSTVRGVPISDPIAMNVTSETVVSIQNGSIWPRTDLTQAWPVIREERPPPLPSRLPKTSRDLPVATVSPVTSVVFSPSRFSPSRDVGPGVLLCQGVPLPTHSTYTPTEEGGGLKPVRPAPAPPPRPAVSRSSSNASAKRPRPAIRPPLPPVQQRRPSNEVVRTAQTPVSGADDVCQPKNSLVAELARRFEQRQAADDVLSK